MFIMSHQRKRVVSLVRIKPDVTTCWPILSYRFYQWFCARHKLRLCSMTLQSTLPCLGLYLLTIMFIMRYYFWFLCFRSRAVLCKLTIVQLNINVDDLYPMSLGPGVHLILQAISVGAIITSIFKMGGMLHIHTKTQYHRLGYFACKFFA